MSFTERLFLTVFGLKLVSVKWLYRQVLQRMPVSQGTLFR